MRVTLVVLLGLFAQVALPEALPPEQANESWSALAICTSLDGDESEPLGSRSRARRWVRPTLEALEAEDSLPPSRPLRTTLDEDYATGVPWLSALRSIRTTLD
jgi:hypothetical protein